MKGRQDPETLDCKQDRALAALLSEPSIEAAARAIDIAPATMWRYLGQPEFKTRLRAARRDVVEGAIGRLQAATTEAVEALRRNLTSGSPAVEVRAATAIIEQATKALTLFDLDERVAQLEARLGDTPMEVQP